MDNQGLFTRVKCSIHSHHVTVLFSFFSHTPSPFCSFIFFIFHVGVTEVACDCIPNHKYKDDKDKMDCTHCFNCRGQKSIALDMFATLSSFYFYLYLPVDIKYNVRYMNVQGFFFSRLYSRLYASVLLFFFVPSPFGCWVVGCFWVVFRLCVCVCVFECVFVHGES
jgi:hypothetical protein